MLIFSPESNWKKDPSVEFNQEDSLFQDLIYDDCLLADHLDHECLINILVGIIYPMSHKAQRYSQAQSHQLKPLMSSHRQDYELRKATNEIT